jgi:hypothetical protein
LAVAGTGFVDGDILLDLENLRLHVLQDFPSFRLLQFGVRRNLRLDGLGILHVGLCQHELLQNEIVLMLRRCHVTRQPCGTICCLFSTKKARRGPGSLRRKRQ